jgi:serine/threonine protein kinase
MARDIIGNFKAVKIIRRSAFSNADPFDREFRGLQRFTPISRSHPGLVHILHVGRNDADGFIYYIMEAGDDSVTGQRIVPESYQPRSLVADILRGGGIPVERVVRHGIALAEALSHLHRHRLIHRDIKPANVIFVNDHPKLADIGLVTEIAAPGQEITLVGTQGYIPMEGHGTPSGDVYSLGKLLYVAVSAQSVTRFPEIPDAVLRNTPAPIREELKAILTRACQMRDSDRYPDADAFLMDLRQLEGRLGGMGQG